MSRWETVIWLLVALGIEKWLDYVERPRWLKRRATKAAAKPKKLTILAAPKRRVQ